ncbi:MAG: alpha/beta hydrolase [Actinobacteria bacterium]|nr:alpha/beta hydrolase [Actinomycetota bacterium]
MGAEAAVDPVVRRILDQLAATGFDGFSSAPLAATRDGMVSAAAAMPKPEVASVVELAVPGPAGPLRTVVYRPAVDHDGPLPVVVFFHGGGFVMGGIESHDALCRSLANASGVAVASVDYRLAPEHAFPAAVDDAWAAVRWIAGHGADVGLDGGRLAVAGDSAGGNLAAVVALLARDAGMTAMRFQLLLYPTLDARLGSPSVDELAEGYMLTKRDLEWFYECYAPPDKDDWRVSPLHAADLSGLPPALVITAQFDPLRDEGEAYVAKLLASGVAAASVRFDGMIHGFLGFPEQLVPASGAALGQAGRALAAALA